jgi:hypothetical protein
MMRIRRSPQARGVDYTGDMLAALLMGAARLLVSLPEEERRGALALLEALCLALQLEVVEDNRHA